MSRPGAVCLAGTAVLLAVAGCAGPDAEGEGARRVDADARASSGGEERSSVEMVTPNVGAADDPTELGLASHWDRWQSLGARWLRESAPDAEYAVHPIREGRHLTLSLVVVRRRLPPPEAERAEVLIAVEGGEAVLEADGEGFRLAPGRVAFLPPGARGVLRARSRAPVLGLRVRAVDPSPRADGARPRVADLDELFPPGPLPPVGEVLLPPEALPTFAGADVEEVAASPGALSLHTAAIPAGSFHPPCVHADHDEVFFLLEGRGGYGLSTAGHLVRSGSLLFAPAGAAHHFEMAAPSGSLALMVFGPAFDPADQGATELVD